MLLCIIIILNFTVGTSLVLRFNDVPKRRDLIGASSGVPYSLSVTHAYSYLPIQQMAITNYYFATVLHKLMFCLITKYVTYL